MLPEIVAEIGASGTKPSARGIAAGIGRLISSGALPVGSRLPTVRELSAALGISPTTVSEAWRSLADVGAIRANGRNGTVVRPPAGPGAPRRYRQITEGPGHFALDLSSGIPDPALLPDLGPVIARVARQAETTSYLDHPVLPALEEALVGSWPFPPEALTVVNGAMDALDRVSSAVLRIGDRVVVERPTFPPLLDLLDRLGCEVEGVAVDEEGPTVVSMQAAVATGPRAVFVQPRAQNPTGVSISPRRSRALAAVLAGSTALIVEDDHANEISTSPLVSFGTTAPARTVHIRSYSKSHGPDLRLAALGGAGDVVASVANRRLLGPGWSSRILQAVLLELLGDPTMDGILTTARDAYALRRAIVSKVLAAEGVVTTGSDGINLWMEVDNERAAMVALAAQGVGVAPGGPFLVHPDVDHLRVTVGLLGGEESRVADVAGLLAVASGHSPARTGRR